MNTKKFYLIKDGKFDMAAIMKRAWCYKNNPFNTAYRNDFKGALRNAWVDAKLEMEDYKASLNAKPARQGYNYGFNVLRSTFLGNHPDNRYADSSWR